jgi:hypothetical protein
MISMTLTILSMDLDSDEETELGEEVGVYIPRHKKDGLIPLIKYISRYKRLLEKCSEH